jgi:HSP20 family protein
MERFVWNPLRELNSAQRQFSALFNSAFPQEPRLQPGHLTWTPSVDVSESPDGYDFAVELPGMSPEGVEVEVKESVLIIKGERKSSEPKGGVRFHHRERPAGRFARAFRMPKPVDAEGVTASYRDGILSVSVPLRAEAKPRKIPVHG